MNELLTILNTIAEENECVVALGNEFAYYDAKSLIVVNPIDTDEAFYNFALRMGLNPKVDNFTISFFHELGHNETIDLVTKFIKNPNALTNEEYFRTEEEWLATEWAINFCNTHLEIIEEIQKFLR